MRYIGVILLFMACAAVVGTAEPGFSRSDLGAEPRNLNGQRNGPKPPGWRNVGPTEPGIIANMAAHPSGAVYLASMGGGVRKSNDFGATWKSVNAGLPPGAVSLAMDASGPDTVYVGIFSAVATARGGVFKSTDGGTTWELSPATANAVPLALEADPSNPGTVFMGALGGPLRKTTDGGATWTISLNPMSPIGSVQIDPTNGNNVYLATLAGAWRSVDGGENWARMTTLTAPNVWGIGIHPTSPNVLYAATNDNGVWRSTNSGSTWQAVSPALTAYSVAVDPTYPNHVHVATRTGMWSSRDAGATWQASGLTDRGVYSIVADSGVLYAGTTLGAAVSYDQSATWTDADPGLGGAHAFGYAITADPNTEGKLFASTVGSTIAITTDAGATWQPSNEGYLSREVRGINVDPTDPSRVYAGSFYTAGLFKSVDGGATWQRRRFGSLAVYVWMPLVDPIQPNIVYAGTQGDGLWKSLDYGDTWTRLAGLPNTVQGITFDPANNSYVFASSSTGIWKSENGGATWANVLTNPAWSVTFVDAASDIVYATAKTAGVFKSTDRGHTWFAINNGITNLTMGRSAPVVLDPENPKVLYVGSEGGGGVYKSRDAGASWTPINFGLDTSVFGLVMDPFRPKTLYASGPSGVYKTLTGGEVKQEDVSSDEVDRGEHGSAVPQDGRRHLARR